MEFKEYSAKTVNDCITDACTSLGVPSDRLDYEVVSEGSQGFMGIGSKPAIIKARILDEEAKKEKELANAPKVVEETPKAEVKEEPKKEEVKEEKVEVNNTDNSVNEVKAKKEISPEVIDTMKTQATEFLKEVFVAMGSEVSVKCDYSILENTLNIDLEGPDMGLLIGKRGQTLDSLQYLVSLVINKGTAEYVRVKVDTENYRSRRKDTLENLAKNIAFKVKRTRRSVSLEPMNPYERRIIHSALQNDRYVTTHSEGEEPFRKVVVTLKK